MDSNNPNIERVSFEEIQEFKDLNLFELAPLNDEYLIVLLAYDAVTKKFGTALLDTNPDSGLSITVNNQSSLLENIEVKTDLLSVERGYIFKQGIDITTILNILSEPPIPPTLSMNLVSDLFEINTAYSLNLSYSYVQNAGGPLNTDTVAFYQGVTGITSPANTTFTVEEEVEFSVLIDMNESTDFLAEKLEAIKKVRAIFPVFKGYSNSGAPSILITPLLQDIKIDKEMTADFTDQHTELGNYWFAVHSSNIPVSWVSLDSSGKESIVNGGPIDSLFEQAPDITYKNNIYSVYVTAHETLFSENVKIKF